MPCMDGEDEADALVRQVKGLTIALCIACTKLTHFNKLPNDLRSWFAAHREADLAREASHKANVEYLVAMERAGKDHLVLGGNHKTIVQRDKAREKLERAESAEHRAAEALCRLESKTTVR